MFGIAPEKILYILCGPAGSGKTTWAKAQSDAVHISRNIIRFDMVPKEDEIFSREEEVYAEWLRQINLAISDKEGPTSVIADATSLTPDRRSELISNLKPEIPLGIVPVNFLNKLPTCLYRNSLRQGREKIPEDYIYQQFKDYIPAYHKEYLEYPTNIYYQIYEVGGIINEQDFRIVRSLSGT